MQNPTHRSEPGVRAFITKILGAPAFAAALLIGCGNPAPQTSYDAKATDGATIHAMWGASASDVWAVGGAADATQSCSASNQCCAFGYVVHWDGTSWSNATTLPDSNQIVAISGVASNDIWAVGQSCASTLAERLYHWDGHLWSLQASGFSTDWGSLRSVSMASSTDGWAIGTVTLGDGSSDSEVLHWDGAHWSRVQDPAITETHLQAVYAAAANNVFIAGDTRVFRFDGTQWAAVTGGAGFPRHFFSAGNTIWLGGTGGIFRWTGSNFSQAVGDLNASGEGILWGASENDLWTFGTRSAGVQVCGSGWTAHECYPEHGYVLHWNGSSWSAIETTNDVAYSAIWGTANGTVWFGGDTIDRVN